MNARAYCDHFIGIHALVRLFSENFSNFSLDLGHSCHAAHQDNIINIAGGKSCIFHGHPTGCHHFFNELVHQPFQLGAGQLDIQVLGAACISCDEGKVDIGFHGTGEFCLGLFSALFQALKGHFVTSQINALVLFKFISQVIDNSQIEILSAQMGVTIGGFDLEDPLADFQNRNVEGTAAQIKNRNLSITLFFHAKGQRSRSGLIDNPLNIQSRNPSSIFCGLSLAVIKIGRNGNNRVGHCFSQITFSGFFHLFKNNGGYFSRTVIFSPDAQMGITVGRLADGVGENFNVIADLRGVVFSTNQSFNRKNRVFRVGHGLPFGGLPHQSLSTFGKPYNRRRCPASLSIGDHNRISTFHHSYARVGCPEINSYRFSHLLVS